MTTNWIRACTVELGGVTYTLDDPQTSLRIRFVTKSNTQQTPNIATVMISNPKPETGQQVKQWEGQPLYISAGYQDNIGLLFGGQITQAIYGRESPTDTLLTVYAGDMHFTHNHAVVNKTFPKGSTPQDHVNAAVAAMTGLAKGFIGPDLSKPVYPRAQSIFRMARDVLGDVARSKQALASYQTGKLQMVQKTQTVPGGAIDLNSKTGLIGMPTQTINGIFARCLINPAIKVNGTVHIDQASISPSALAIQGANGDFTNAQAQTLTPAIAADGLYKVYLIELNGDTRGNPWYMDLTLGAINVSEGQLSVSPAVLTNYAASGNAN